MAVYDFFTNKQAGVIYSAVKSGDVRIERRAISYMYNDIVCANEPTTCCPEIESVDVNMFYHVRATLHLIVDAITENDYARANKLARKGISGKGFWYSGSEW